MLPHNRPLVSSRRRSRAAFTLVELLAVIAIIGVIAAILIPTVGAVRSSARWAQGSANIRQSTMGLIAMANDNRGRLMRWDEPKPNKQPGNWANLLTQYVAGGDLNTTPTKTHPCLLDPLVDLTSNASGVFHFASADLQAPGTVRDTQFAADGIFAAWAQYRNIRAYPNPSLQVFLVDAGTNADGAGAYGNLPNGQLNIYNVIAQARSTANDPIDPGPGGLGYIRWTDGKAKFGFMDGHVAILKMAEVKRKNFNPALQ